MDTLLQERLITLPDGYLMRPASLADIPEAVNMWNAWAVQRIGVEKFIVSKTETEWHTPGFDLDRDTRVVITPDGQIVGYYEVWDLSDPHVMIHCWGRTHPEHDGRGIGTALLGWAEERARQAFQMAPEGARVALMAGVPSIETAGEQLFVDCGFELVRYSLRMVIDLDELPAPPVVPEGIVVRPMLKGQEERAVLQAVRDSFKDHWGYVERPFEDDYARWQHFIQNHEDYVPELWFVAVDGDQIAGISLCYPTVDDDPGMGWVGTLGVCRAWRRRGLGLALLQHSFREFYQRGQCRVGLGVDAKSLTGATRLYLKAGMRPDPQGQLSIFEKELRPGRDLSTQSL